MPFITLFCFALLHLRLRLSFLALCVYVCFVSHCWTQPWWERKEGGREGEGELRWFFDVIENRTVIQPFFFVCLFQLLPLSLLYIYLSAYGKQRRALEVCFRYSCCLPFFALQCSFCLFVFPLPRGFFAQKKKKKQKGKKTAKRKKRRCD